MATQPYADEPTFLLGKLNWDSLAFLHDPILLGTFIGADVVVAVVLVWVTWNGWWGYLWKEWFCSIDHKKIGIMYIVLALVMLLARFCGRTHDAHAPGAGLWR